MSGLNQAQDEAVKTLKGPLLVLAGAGTGKTRVVTFRIANLIKNGIKPSRILGVTFTNKAAQEMKERISVLQGKKRKSDRPMISTFHSLCVKILRRRITALGYPPKYSIIDRSEQESVAKSILREIRIDDSTVKPTELLWKISADERLVSADRNTTGILHPHTSTSSGYNLVRLGYNQTRRL